MDRLAEAIRDLRHPAERLCAAAESVAKSVKTFTETVSSIAKSFDRIAYHLEKDSSQ